MTLKQVNGEAYDLYDILSVKTLMLSRVCVCVCVWVHLLNIIVGIFNGASNSRQFIFKKKTFQQTSIFYLFDGTQVMLQRGINSHHSFKLFMIENYDCRAVLKRKLCRYISYDS